MLRGGRTRLTVAVHVKHCCCCCCHCCYCYWNCCPQLQGPEVCCLQEPQAEHPPRGCLHRARLRGGWLPHVSCSCSSLPPSHPHGLNCSQRAAPGSETPGCFCGAVCRLPFLLVLGPSACVHHACAPAACIEHDFEVVAASHNMQRQFHLPFQLSPLVFKGVPKGLDAPGCLPSTVGQVANTSYASSVVRHLYA